jgi:steroid delta-isomerase-like uncharacterized protein
MPSELIRVAQPTITSHAEIGRRVLLAVDDGQIENAVEQFDEDFLLRDNGLDLELRDRPRLAGFFRKRRDIFPEVHCELNSTIVNEDCAVLQWTLTGFVLSAFYGQRVSRARVKTSGVSVIEFDQGKIRRWSDYYDSLAAMRSPLVTYFKEYDEL